MGDRWWEDAVIYQVYLRSFADGNGDGYGDIPGLRSRLGYLRSLGVDAVWVSPWYPSPMRDGGYDVADYQDIDPLFGSLEDAAALFEDAHRIGLRVLIDVVPNHTSDQHPWFLAALSSAEGAPARERYYFRDGRGPDGSLPPNDWPSAFGGPAWSRTTRPDGSPGQWYLHLFAPEQPDLNWGCGEVQHDFEKVMRFWYDLGADGCRVDAVPAMGKDSTLPDAGIAASDVFSPSGWPETPLWDGESVHGVLRSWRAVAASYSPEKFLVGEVIVNGPARLARYLRDDELHSVLGFELSRAPWSAEAFRACIGPTLDGPWPGRARPTWFLSSHDEVRAVTRYAQAQAQARDRRPGGTGQAQLAAGTARARAALLVMLALPGAACIYQGEELGLWQVEDLPLELLEDPIVARTGDPSKGRDGCRVPVPWAGGAPPFAFTPGPSSWLPQPRSWADLTVDHQQRSAGSTLRLVTRALELRRETAGLLTDRFEWREPGDGALAFERGAGFSCVANFDGGPLDLPPGTDVVLASGPLAGDGRLPAGTAAWLTVSVPLRGRRPGS